MCQLSSKLKDCSGIISTELLVKGFLGMTEMQAESAVFVMAHEHGGQLLQVCLGVTSVSHCQSASICRPIKSGGCASCGWGSSIHPVYTWQRWCVMAVADVSKISHSMPKHYR